MRRLIIAAMTLAPATAFADGYLIPNSNPRDLALGGATVATAEGAGALTSNTAALAGPEGLAVSASLAGANNQTEWSDGGQDAKLSNGGTPVGAAVSFGMKLPNDQALAFGAGFGVPGGGSLDWPKGWAGQEVFQSVNLQIFGINAGVAFQAKPWLKFGASYTRYQASEEIHQKLNYLDHLGDAGIGLAGSADTFGVAAEVHVPDVPLSLGVTYTHTANVDFTGHVHFTDVPPSFQTLLHDQGITETLVMPDVVVAGLAYEVIPNLRVMGALTFEHWSDYKEDRFVGTDAIMNADGTTTHFTAVVPRNFDNAWIGRVGAEWKAMPFWPKLTGRAGIARTESGQGTTTLSPSLTDASSWAFSLGAGFEVKRDLNLNIGLQGSLYDQITANMQTPDTFQGTYKTKVFLGSIGVDWRTDLGMGAAAK
jgi:long-chain fatty acid transport protein